MATARKFYRVLSPIRVDGILKLPGTDREPIYAALSDADANELALLKVIDPANPLDNLPDATPPGPAKSAVESDAGAREIAPLNAVDPANPLDSLPDATPPGPADTGADSAADKKSKKPANPV